MNANNTKLQPIEPTEPTAGPKATTFGALKVGDYFRHELGDSVNGAEVFQKTLDITTDPHPLYEVLLGAFGGCKVIISNARKGMDIYTGLNDRCFLCDQHGHLINREEPEAVKSEAPSGEPRKFSVGDKIIVRKPKDTMFGPVWVQEMDQWDGKTVTVRDVADFDEGQRIKTEEAPNLPFASHVFSNHWAELAVSGDAEKAPAEVPAAPVATKGLTLEVGKTYLTRDGQKVKLTDEVNGGRGCGKPGFTGEMADDERDWNIDGTKKYVPAGGPLDLVSEVKEELVLEVGKTYVTRDGRRVMVFHGPDGEGEYNGRFGGRFEADSSEMLWHPNGKKWLGFRDNLSYLYNDGWDIVALAPIAD